MNTIRMTGTCIRRFGARAVLGFALVGAPVAAFAQAGPNAAPPVMAAPQAPGMNPPPPPPHGRMHRDHMEAMRREFDSLGLSPEQRTRIDDLMMKFHEDHRGTRPAKSDMKALHDQVMDVLTPEQREKFMTDMKAERMHHPDRMYHKNMMVPSQQPTVAP